jgi:SsrA-binding protein
MQTRIVNRKARFDYEILETVEAGIELVGTEVKSIRAGKVSLRDAFARVRRGELFLYGADIALYENAGYAKHEPTRPRRLLLHARETARLKIYFKRGWAKIEIGLARARRQYDKREVLKKRETERDIKRAMSFRR